MPRYVMVIDSSRCINCKTCVAACQQENRVPYGYARNWIKVGAGATSPGLHFQPGNCMHCDEPICVSACPTGATFKDPADGVVKVNTALCIGCGSCIATCPYGARFRNPELGVADKCDYCPRLRALGREPACVAVCPTRARRFGDLDDPASGLRALIDKGPVVRLTAPATDTKPAIFYLGRTSPTDWPKDVTPPLPIGLWGAIMAPLTRVVGGAVLLGVAGVALRQLVAGRGEGQREGHGKAS